MHRNLIMRFSPILFAVFFIVIILPYSAFSQDGCKLLNKDKPVIYISFERIIQEGKNKIIQLRLNNNTTCNIVVPIEYEEKSNKNSTACIPSTFGELQNNSAVKLNYGIYTSGAIYFPGSGDVVDSAVLRGGNSIIFNVPIKMMKKGQLKLDFKYDWEVCNDSQEQFSILKRELTFHSSELQKLIK